MSVETGFISDTPSVRPTEFESVRRRESRAEFLDRLNYKVEAVLDFGWTIERLDPHAGPEETHRALGDIRATVEQIFPPTTLVRYQRLKAVRQRERELNISNMRLQEGGDLDASMAAIAAQRAELRQLEDEELTLFEDEDLQFLMNVDGVLDDLGSKNNIVDALRGDPARTIDELNAYLREDKLNLDDIVELQYTPFEITAVLKSSAYDRVCGKDDQDSLGIHFSRSPYSIVRAGPDIEKTIHHESVHNLIDQASGIGQYSTSRLEDLVERHAATNDAAERFEIEQRVAQHRPRVLVNQMHNELLAELGHWEQHPWNKNRSKILFLDPNRPKSFEFHANNYSTAGNDAAEISALLEKIGRECKDEATREQILGTREAFRQGFTQAVEHMRQALISTRSRGEKAMDELHALLFVLPPSRYRHLDRYLDGRHETGPKSEAK